MKKTIIILLLLMLIKSTKQEDKQRIPISWKPMGELVPNNLDGHLHIQIPIFNIKKHVQNIRKEHEENKETRGKITFSSINSKKCLDDLRMKYIVKCPIFAAK